MKLRGHVDDLSRTGVRGWAIDEEQPERALTVAVTLDGVRIASGVAEQPRPGLVEKYGADNARHGFALSFDPPISPLRKARVDVVEAQTGQRLQGGLREVKGLDRGPAPLRPILVTSTGRSGTTLLMSEFVRHPRIVVANRFAYEVKLLSYYSAALKVLTHELDRVNSTDPDHLFDKAGQFQIGFNPFNGPSFYNIVRNKTEMARLFEEVIPSGYANLFAGFIRQYYELVRADQSKPDAVHFAEKITLDEGARQGPRVLFGEVREIVLLRDPRDLLCSAKAFWKLPGPEALGMIKTTVGQVYAVATSKAHDVTAIRYEDLVQAPKPTRASLYKFLGIRDDDDDGTLGNAALFGRHGTSENADASIGRWRKDLSSDEIAACNKAFAAYMETFGYQR